MKIQPHQAFRYLNCMYLLFIVSIIITIITNNYCYKIKNMNV